MEGKKILHLLNEESNSKFVTRNWNIVNDQSNANYDVGNEISIRQVLKSNLCEFSDAYILVRGDTTINEHNATQVVFKNCAPNTKCITKIDGTTIDDAGDFNLVIPFYNLTEHSSEYSETMGSFWFHSKDEAIKSDADIANKKFKSFAYKAKLLDNTEADDGNGIVKNVTIAVPLKYLSNF